MNKLKLWNEHETWEQAQSTWEEGAEKARQEAPIKGLKRLPKMPGIAPETQRFLKWKSFKYIALNDEEGVIRKNILKHPLRYGWNLFKSLFVRRSYVRDEDFYYFGIDSEEAFRREIQKSNSLLVVGFSYCHKPFECPCERFTPDCIHDPENLVCRQCFIGKTVNTLPEEQVIPLFVPTIFYIGEQLFKIIEENPDKKVSFLITTCEMILEMCGDIANMLDIKGVGVRLDGRICNTMHALELSERGVKPGLTVVLDATQERMLDLIRFRRESCKPL